ncbi:DoxX family protein [Opitutales bacterium ASA1]|uniref:DoxX family protein n=1 Tax=Congregicoccus parvus TaxID=3081749 RepID=UPI002B2BD364|nr:DoxX family protein [Opitutales bacterium ASA1]
MSSLASAPSAQSAGSVSSRIKIASWIARVVVAVILLQTLFFKFTAAPESVHIFETLGAEPWGRLASGVAELVAAVFLLLPATVAFGAALALGVMLGAIGSHLFVLGIVVQDDGGTLFAMALLVAALSAWVLWLHRRTLPVIGSRLG